MNRPLPIGQGYKLQKGKVIKTPSRYGGGYHGGARRTQYDGRWYQSAMEANYAAELDYRLKAGEIKSWKPQVRIDVRLNDTHICDYLIDFVVEYFPTDEHPDGLTEWVEVKGLENEKWGIKKNCTEAMVKDMPHHRYIIVRKVKKYLD